MQAHILQTTPPQSRSRSGLMSAWASVFPEDVIREVDGKQASISTVEGGQGMTTHHTYVETISQGDHQRRRCDDLVHTSIVLVLVFTPEGQFVWVGLRQRRSKGVSLPTSNCGYISCVSYSYHESS